MKNININVEWDFITREVHNEKPNIGNLLKREILFSLQILLSQGDFDNYFKTKKLYSLLPN